MVFEMFGDVVPQIVAWAKARLAEVSPAPLLGAVCHKLVPGYGLFFAATKKQAPGLERTNRWGAATAGAATLGAAAAALCGPGALHPTPLDSAAFACSQTPHDAGGRAERVPHRGRAPALVRAAACHRPGAPAIRAVRGGAGRREGADLQTRGEHGAQTAGSGWCWTGVASCDFATWGLFGAQGCKTDALDEPVPPIVVSRCGPCAFDGEVAGGEPTTAADAGEHGGAGLRQWRCAVVEPLFPQYTSLLCLPGKRVEEVAAAKREEVRAAVEAGLKRRGGAEGNEGAGPATKRAKAFGGMMAHVLGDGDSGSSSSSSSSEDEEGGVGGDAA